MPSIFAVGGRFELHGVTHTVADVGTPAVVKAYRENDYSLQEFSIEKLISEPGFKPVRLMGTPKKDPTGIGVTQLPPQQQELVSARRALIEPCYLLAEAKMGNRRAWIRLRERFPGLVGTLDGPNDLRMTAAVAYIFKTSGVSAPTIWRYWAAFREFGEQGLVSRAGQGVAARSDNRCLNIRHPRTGEVLQTLPTRLGPRQIEVFEKVVETEYFQLRRPRHSEMYRRVYSLCHMAGILPVPDETTVRRLLGQISPGVADRFRLSDQEYRRKHKGYKPGAAQEFGDVPLHSIQLDHQQIEFVVVDEETGLVLGRPYVTVGIDVYSKMPWCIILSFEGTNTHRVETAILQGVSPKLSRERWGTANDWPVWGVPGNILTDNGVEFHSRQFERILVDVLHLDLRFRPPGQPSMGPYIERAFGTLNTRVSHTVPGARKPPGKAGDYDPEAAAEIGLKKAEELLIRFFVDIYPYEDHSGLPPEEPTPAIRWAEGLKRFGVNQMAFLDQDELERVRFGFLDEVQRGLDRGGISINNIKYQNLPATEGLLYRGIKSVTVKVDHEDVSHCWVLDGDKWEEYLAASPAASELTGLGVVVWSAMRKRKKEIGSALKAAVPGHASMPTERAEFEAEIAKMSRSPKRKERVKAAQLKANLNPVQEKPRQGVEAEPIVVPIDPDAFEDY